MTNRMSINISKLGMISDGKPWLASIYVGNEEVWAKRCEDLEDALHRAGNAWQEVEEGLDSDDQCSACSGSGEGMAPDTACQVCNGAGIARRESI